MTNLFRQQVKVVTGQEAVRPSTINQEIAFFDEDGNPIIVGVPTADFVAQNTTVAGSDPATTQALANSLKTTVNDILTELKAAGLMASS